VSLSERLFGRSSVVKLDLPAIRAKVATAVRDGLTADPLLTRARLADALRDAGCVPPLPEETETAVAGLDAEAVGRLAAAVTVLELDEVKRALTKLLVGRSPSELVAMLASVARDTPLLTSEVLRQSDLRVEELARRLVAGLGAAVARPRNRGNDSTGSTTAVCCPRRSKRKLRPPSASKTCSGSRRSRSVGPAGGSCEHARNTDELCRIPGRPIPGR